MLGLNFLLALSWLVLNNSYTPADLIVGLLFGFLVIRVSWRVFSEQPFSARQFFTFGTRRPLLMTWRWLRFMAFGFVEIVKSSVAVARSVLSPNMNLRPGIVAIPLDVQSDEGITTLANLITLTPGTVSLDVSSDRKTLYIHAYDVVDPEALRRDTKAVFERRVQELWP
jgi:multicomponent Na+:H+ antiporter subunit E